MIEFRDVSKVYARRGGGRLPVLTDVSVEVGRGELVVLVGATGAGKSTLLRLISGEERPTAGRVSVDGAEVGALSRRGLARLRRRLGVLPQEPRLVADRTIFGNVAVVLRALGVSPAEARTQALEALRDVGLAARPHAYPHELAAGERGRLALARALAREPEVLLADEPAPMLDDAATREIVEILRAVHARGATVVVATRDAELGAALKARVLLLEGGRVRPGEAGC